MKKTMITSILIGSMLLCSCNSAAGNSETPSPSPAATESASPAASANAQPTASAASGEKQSADTKTQTDMEGMLPILDSITRATGIEGELSYAPEDAAFFWQVLYLMGNNWGDTHPFIEPAKDGVTTIPTQVMEEFAGAAFSTYKELPAIPKSMNSSISFDAEKDAYILSPSDMGSTQTKINNISVAQDGVVSVTVGLYDGTTTPDDFLGAVLFTLVKHPNADGVSNSAYLYCVTGATQLPKE